MHSHTPAADEFAFPADLPVPQPLCDLLQACPQLRDSSASVSGFFAFHAEPPRVVARYFGGEGHASGQFAAQQLGVFGTQPDGAAIAVWRAPQGGMPVVYLGSEGGGRVLASDALQFLRLLGIGYGEFALSGDMDDPPEEGSEVARELLEWLARQGLAVPSTGEDIVSEAEQRWPDFDGWIEDAVQGRLQQSASGSAVPATGAAHAPAPEGGGSPWAQVLACIGRRIDDPVVRQWLASVGAKPLKPATPHNNRTYVTSQSTGIAVFAERAPRHRSLWPPVRDGRVWRTHVVRILVPAQAAQVVPLPQGLSWQHFPGTDADDPYVTQPVNDMLEMILERDGEGPGIARVFVKLRQELDFIEASASYEETQPLVYVEGAFFATWCALHGLLNPQRYPDSMLAPWRARVATPLQFLHGPCQRIVWSSDITDEANGFWGYYYKGFGAPDDQRWQADIQAVFGSSNHFRDPDEARTPDSWEAFDAIAPTIAMRFAEWRATLAAG